ncbi:twin-arginine translocation pathway signal [Oceaniovalibus guishaninsula JLT2003]|uniref:Twin-arginine translocation pathway signal n=1 Tax=Oceaniovalibus guishaninsula JLT2003 TaxID=1231392 RepID=K2HC85_9RHOB|nr:DUF1501 domain-containing protein [Oceaniovalibus guishaninsula]EKE44222.1 twin-arginine translocation pathway signal [Oceaniovalibus guishaninsula JLT2003]
MDRRNFLSRGAALIGCSAAAHPLMTTVTFASAPWDTRLVVLILRGAMDGLGLVQPAGDPDFASLRSGILRQQGDASLPLNGFYEAHPSLAPLMPLWDAGQLAFMQAVSTPYRGKRSHFDGQDLLEAGSGMDMAQPRDGWLNRMLQTVPHLDGRTAYAIGSGEMKLLIGPARVAEWSPHAELKLTSQTRRLLDEIYHDDPLFRDTATEAIALTELEPPDPGTERGAMLAQRMAVRGGTGTAAMAAFAADRLYNDARIAAFSIQGWDTHRDQGRFMKDSVADLADAILTLRAGLGDVWDKTVVLAMTEFGRTVRENGSKGTDHGTGGAAVMAGGAIRGGRVYGDWPGLSESALYERRDLMPTRDVRAMAAWTMRGLFGLDRSVLEGAVFPGLDMGRDPGLLL